MSEAKAQEDSYDPDEVGYLIFNRLSAVKECRVRRRSNAGVVIEADPDFCVSHVASVVIPKLDINARCRVIWLQDRMHGIEFITTE